ncbi:hypothetical protein [Phenylobacterium sp.]|jgi:Tfp pilus assembly protein PilF|uniref:hypothetical protein n=1 Tax=Phenylobacterium sp. TaxID=1871053 RepID=UPI002F9490C9
MADGNNTAQRRRLRKAPPLTTADPVEIAMEAEASGRAPVGQASLLLAEQRRLIRWQVTSERAGALVKLLTGVAGAAVLVFSSAMVWQAARTNGVVLQPFATPPGMAEKGLTGAVVAGQVLDRLKTIQAETSTTRAVATYGGGWGDGIRLSIPNTGISLGELQGYLVRWLGDETQVTGDVFLTADGALAVTTRVGAAAGVTVKGAPGDLDALVGKSAEAIYAASQPYLYSTWLVQHDRAAEALPIVQRLIYSADKTERLWALLAMSRPAMGAVTQDERRYIEAALRIDPDFMPAVLSLAGHELREGNNEASLKLRRRLADGAKLYRRQVKRDLADENLLINQAYLAIFTGDYGLAVAATQKMLEAPTTSTGRRQNAMRSAQAAIWLHDLPLARGIRDEGGLNEAALAALEASVATGGSLAARERRALEDWPAAAEGFAPIWANARSFAFERAAYLIALARAGRVEEAQAALAANATMPGVSPGVADRYDFLIARGVIAEALGRRGDADGLFARAVALGPSFPHAHEAWSRALLDRRDAAGALREARLAVKKGPRWPDAHRAHGRTLHALGKEADAARAYAEAAKLTPSWGALEIDWGVALAAQGQRDAAVARWRRAASLDLGPADRRRVEALLASSA